MVDDSNKRSHSDQTSINIREEHEVRYWCERIQCTRAELEEAVAQIGIMSEDVESYLKRKKAGGGGPASG